MWGRSNELGRVFVCQKTVISLGFNINTRESCNKLLQYENTVTVTSIYIQGWQIFQNNDKSFDI